MKKHIKIIIICGYFFVIIGTLCAAQPVSTDQTVSNQSADENKDTGSSVIQNAILQAKKDAASNQNDNTATPSDAQVAIQLQKNIMDPVFAFFPDDTKSENNLLPALANAIDTLYVKNLKVSSDLVVNIKKLYAYLQREVINKDLANLTTQITTAQTSLQTAQKNKDPKVTQYQQKLNMLQQMLNQKKQALNGTIIKRCQGSKSWQQYLKIFITDSFDYEMKLLDMVHSDQKIIFQYIPQFETAYYNDSYAKIRLNSEAVRMYLLLTDVLRDRAISQCSDWGKAKDQSALYNAIMTFKKMEFYQFVQKFFQASSSKKTYPLCSRNTLIDATSKALNPLFLRYFQLGGTDGQQLMQTDMAKNFVGIDPQTGDPLFTEMGNMLLTFIPATATTPAQIQPNELYQKLFTDTPTGTIPTDLYVEMMAFTAIKMINGFLQSLFDMANLDNTMESYATVDETLLKSFPSCVPYMPEDYFYLDELNSLNQQLTAQPATVTNNTAAQTQGFISFLKNSGKSFAHNMSKAGKTIAKSSVSLGKNISGLVTNAGQSIGFLAAGLCTSPFDSSLSDKFLAKGTKYMTAFNNNIGGVVTDLLHIVNGLIDASVAENILLIHVLLSPVVAMESRLGNNLVGVFDTGQVSMGEITKNTIGLQAYAIIMPMKLTFQAIQCIVVAVVDTLASALSGTNKFGGLVNFSEYLLQDFLTMELQIASFSGNLFLESMRGIMAATAYFAAVIADISADVNGAVMALNAGVHGKNMAEGFAEGKKTVDAHRRAIISATTFAVMVALSVWLSVVTGGGLGWLIFGLVMTAAFSIPALVGAVQEDAIAVTDEANQELMLEEYRMYLEDSKRMLEINKEHIITELNYMLDGQKKNAEINVAYTQNFLNSNFNSMVSSSAYGLGTFYNNQTIDDSIAQVAPADLGYLYGIKTGRISMNPSQGFKTYNPTRNTFAEEIAELPQQLVTKAQNSTATTLINPSITKHWINQKDLSFISRSGNSSSQDMTVEIRWRVLYTCEASFYIGLFLTEQAIDIDYMHAINKNFEDAQQYVNKGSYVERAWQNLDSFNRQLLNFNHLGKAFVCFRESDDQLPTMGLYEHEGSGWINKNIASTTYQQGIWYRMKVQIQDKKLMGKCWKESDQEPTNWHIQSDIHKATPMTNPPLITLPTTTAIDKNTNTTAGTFGVGQATTANQSVSTKYAGSLGVISSGAAIEYDIVSPASTILVTDSRKQNNKNSVDTLFNKNGVTASEQQREKEWLTKNQAAQKPEFGSFTLTNVSLSDMQQGCYVYSTKDTGLPNNMTDYVVFAASVTGTGSAGIANNLGISPVQNPKALVSLITGKAFGPNKTVLATCSGVSAAYEKSYTLTEATKAEIDKIVTNYFVASVGTYQFKNNTLHGEVSAIQNGVYVYNCTSMTQGITGLDYFVMATLGANGTYNAYGQMFDQNNAQINGMISLVTGSVFMFNINNQSLVNLVGKDIKKVTIMPVANAPIYSNLLSSIADSMGATLYTAIQNQNNAYQVAYQAILAQRQVVPKAPVIPTSTAPNKTFFQAANDVKKTNKPIASFNSLQAKSGLFDGFGGPF